VSTPIFFYKIKALDKDWELTMRFRLIFKQALKDFKNKVQLYLSFTAFIIIAIGLILGLFSFNFSVQDQFDAVASLVPKENAQNVTFQFTSVNTDH